MLLKHTTIITGRYITDKTIITEHSINEQEILERQDVHYMVLDDYCGEKIFWLYGRLPIIAFYPNKKGEDFQTAQIPYS